MTDSYCTVDIFHDTESPAPLTCPQCGREYLLPTDKLAEVLDAAAPDDETTCRECASEFVVLDNLYVTIILRLSG